MKITKTANKKQITISKKEWESIGKTAGWMKTAMYLEEDIAGESVAVYNNSNEPYFIIEGCGESDLDLDAVKSYLKGADWTDRGAKGWITPRLKCDDFLKIASNNAETIKTAQEFEEEDDWSNEPDEDDCFLTPVGSLGSKISVSCGGKSIGIVSTEEEGRQMIKNWQEKEQFFPTTWWVSDHGNSWPIDLNTGEEIK